LYVCARRVLGVETQAEIPVRSDRHDTPVRRRGQEGGVAGVVAQTCSLGLSPWASGPRKFMKNGGNDMLKPISAIPFFFSTSSFIANGFSTLRLFHRPRTKSRRPKEQVCATGFSPFPTAGEATGGERFLFPVPCNLFPTPRPQHTGTRVCPPGPCSGR